MSIESLAQYMDVSIMFETLLNAIMPAQHMLGADHHPLVQAHVATYTGPIGPVIKDKVTWNAADRGVAWRVERLTENEVATLKANVAVYYYIWYPMGITIAIYVTWAICGIANKIAT